MYGGSSAEVVGEMTMIGVHLLGGVGGLLSGMTGEIDLEMSSCDPAILVKSSSRIGRRGMGVMIRGGRCLSGMPLKGSGRMGEFVGTVGVRTSIVCHSL